MHQTSYETLLILPKHSIAHLLNPANFISQVFADFVYDRLLTMCVDVAGSWQQNLWVMGLIGHPGWVLVDFFFGVFSVTQDDLTTIKNDVTSFVDGIKAAGQYIVDTLKLVINAVIQILLKMIIKTFFFTMSTLIPQLSYDTVSGDKLKEGSSILLGLEVQFDVNRVYLIISSDNLKNFKFSVLDPVFLSGFKFETLGGLSTPQSTALGLHLVDLIGHLAIQIFAKPFPPTPETVGTLNFAVLAATLVNLIANIAPLITFWDDKKRFQQVTGINTVFHIIMGLSLLKQIHTKRSEFIDDGIIKYNSGNGRLGKLNTQIRSGKTIFENLAKNMDKNSKLKLAKSIVSFLKQDGLMWKILNLVAQRASSISLVFRVGEEVNNMIYNLDFSALSDNNFVGLLIGAGLGLIAGYLPFRFAFPKVKDSRAKADQASRFMAYGQSIMLYAYYHIIFGLVNYALGFRVRV